MAKKEPPAPKVTCGKCGYEWTRRGKLGALTCPNCRHTVRVPSLINVA